MAGSGLPDLIEQARVARLATVDSERRPSLVPICFVVDGSVLYSPLDAKPKRRPARELQRVRNILQNPTVAVLIDRYDEDWDKLQYVLIRGIASLLEADRAEHAAARRQLAAKYEQYARMEMGALPVIRVAIERITVWPDRRVVSST